MSQQKEREPIYVDKKDKEHKDNQSPIINLINSVLKSMEEVQWHFTHRRTEGADQATATNVLLFGMNRISIASTEKQILADKDRLYKHIYVSGRLSTSEIMEICYRFQQYLLSDIFQQQHGITYQNPNARHISE